MAIRDEMIWGAPCWMDLSTTDLGRATDFYGEVFGWAAEDRGADYGNYVVFTRGGKSVGGMMLREPGIPGPDSWTPYLASQDAVATTRVARDGGALVFVDPIDVMELGTMAIIADPGGAGVGIWQPNEFIGTELVAAAGAPCWYELHTREYRAVVEFYRTTFNWDTDVMSDTDEYRYSRMLHNGEPYAGVIDAAPFLPESAPSSWQIYFGAEDVDATVALIVDLGGAVIRPVEDSPFGRVAQVCDPMGATFKLNTAPSE